MTIDFEIGAFSGCCRRQWNYTHFDTQLLGWNAIWGYRHLAAAVEELSLILGCLEVVGRLDISNETVVSLILDYIMLPTHRLNFTLELLGAKEKSWSEDAPAIA